MINNSGVQIRVTTYSKISFSKISWQWLQPQGGKEWTGEEP